MAHDFQTDLASIGKIVAIPSILDTVCRITGMGFAAVVRVTDDRWIACGVHDEIAFGLKPGGELKVETTICREVKQTGSLTVIDHVAEDPAFRDHPAPALYGFQSYISVPIVLPDGRFFGTLCAIDPKPARIDTPGTIGMFKLFAEMIAFHIEANERVAASEAILLNERHASDLREQFIAVLGHDLRNPLAAIDAGVNMLKRTVKGDEETQIIDLVRGSVARMSGLIDNVLDFARGRLGGGLPLNKDPYQPLAPILEQVVAELRAAWPNRSIEIDIDLTEPVHCDRVRVAQLFSNLLGNALSYGASDKPVRVSARTDKAFFNLAVSNEGEPVPPATIENMFQPFVRGAASPSQQGLGLGLYIASEVARAHGGALEVTSTAKETCFTLRMPLG